MRLIIDILDPPWYACTPAIGNQLKHLYEMHAFNLATISQQLNTILIIGDNLRFTYWALMVGATGIEPVTPAVSRQCSTAELRTQYLINYSKLKINL